MSTAEVARPADGNAQAAQDVQDLLAELKDSQKLGDVPAAPEQNDAEKAGEKKEAAEADPPAENDKNGVKESETQKEDVGKGKQEDGAEKSAPHNQESRPFRGGGQGRGGGRGRRDFKPYKQNIKSDLTNQEETDDPIQIRRQVEFYFSDSNLPMDKFLLSQVGGSKNLAVDLKMLHSFKRMRRFQPFSSIVTALKESKFVELTDDDTKVKRKEPLPDKVDPNEMDRDSIRVWEDRAMPRSIYAKGFGEEDKDTQLDIEKFFTPYGPWNAVRLRRAHDKVFKGSVFVEFDSEETQQKFLHLDPKPTYKGKDLQILSKKAYCDKKVEDIKAGKVKAGRQDFSRGRGGSGYQQSKRKRDDEDDRDWRERRDDDRKNGSRDSRRGGRGGGGGGGGRDHGGRSRRDQGNHIRKDARGIPIVEITEEKKPRDAATADALAQARAIVEAENAAKEKQKEAEDADTKPAVEGNGEEKKEVVEADATAVKNSKKRSRDEGDDGEKGDEEGEGGLPAAKRVGRGKIVGEETQESMEG